MSAPLPPMQRPTREEALRALPAVLGEQLEGHPPAKARVAGEEDLAHPSLAERSNHLVVLERVPSGEPACAMLSHAPR